MIEFESAKTHIFRPCPLAASGIGRVSGFVSLRIGLAGREENQIFCYAKHANELVACLGIDMPGWIIEMGRGGGRGNF